MTEFLNQLGSADMQSLILVLESYQDSAFNEEIEDVGFNKYSGYVYIYLSNGICIASAFGRDAVFIVSNFDTGEEDFYNTYINAINRIEDEEEF